MKKIHFFIISLFIMFFISSNLQADQNASELTDRMTEINKITSEEHLRVMLDRKYKYEYDQHIENAVKLKLVLLEPNIIEHYGNLQFNYDFWQTTKTYSIGTTCTLYIDHIRITILDSQGNTINTHQFDGSSGGTKETFKTVSGACQPKTNEAIVYISRICHDLLKGFDKDTLLQVAQHSQNECLQVALEEIGAVKPQIEPRKLPTEKILKLQKRLVELGYDPGPVDGLWGKKAKDALKKFQQDNGLSVTGKLDDETQKKLDW